MKKVSLLLSVVFITAMMLSSCGTSPCDCKSEAEKLQKEIAENPADVEDLEQELKDLAEECNEYTHEDMKDC